MYFYLFITPLHRWTSAPHLTQGFSPATTSLLPASLPSPTQCLRSWCRQRGEQTKVPFSHSILPKVGTHTHMWLTPIVPGDHSRVRDLTGYAESDSASLPQAGSRLSGPRGTRVRGWRDTAGRGWGLKYKSTLCKVSHESWTSRLPAKEVVPRVSWQSSG